MASRQSADHDHGGRIRNSNHADGRRQRRRDWRRKRRCNYRADDRRKNGIKRLARYAQRGPVRAAPKGGQPRGCHGGRSSGGGGGNVGEGLEIGHAQRLPIAAFPVKRIRRNPALLIRHGTRGWAWSFRPRPLRRRACANAAQRPSGRSHAFACLRHAPMRRCSTPMSRHASPWQVNIRI